MADPVLIAKGEHEVFFLPKMANRHGLIAGATGTGKTVSLQVIAERLSAQGVPVFMADVKGDLSGVSQAGTGSPRILERLKLLGETDYPFHGSPVDFWDVFGEQGHPVRATVSEMGPLLLSRLLNLNDTQAGVLSLAFKFADDNGLLLVDLKDVRALLQHLGENAQSFTTEYGNISAASVGAIQRGLLTLDQQGGDKLFGEPALDLMDFVQTRDGKGVINILSADKLISSPLMYSTLLLWLLSELWERMPEVGDVDKPKLVFFFDEAHLLFTDAPDALLQKIEQVVRLIRSKGVGVFFVTQNPLDVPDKVLAQLGNRVQHALRAFTPRDQKAVDAAADTFRQNPKLDVKEAITQLGVGEALVSLLDEKGIPGIVERAFIYPPFSQIGSITPEQRKAIVSASDVNGHYEAFVDRESAYEILKGRAAETQQPGDVPKTDQEKQAAFREELLRQSQAAEQARAPKVRPAAREPRSEVDKVLSAFATTAARTVASQLTRSISRGLLGGILGGLMGSKSRR